MKRLQFLRRLISLAWISLPAVFHQYRGAENVEIYEGRVAGFYYYDGPEILDSLHQGQSLLLIREPENEYDHRAIEVYAGESKLGYIPRADNKLLARLMDQGVPLEAWITEVNRSGYVSQRIGVGVWMTLSDTQRV